MPRLEDENFFLELRTHVTREANRIMAAIDILTTAVQTAVASQTQAISDQAAAIAALAGTGASDPAIAALTAQLAASNTALAASNAKLEAALGTAPGGSTVPPVPAGLPVSVTAGSPIVTFLTPQSFAAGAAIAFAGVSPQSSILTATSSSLTATLAAPFTGTTNASATTAATVPTLGTPPVGTPPPGTPATSTTTPGSFPAGVPVGITEGSPVVTFKTPQNVVAGQTIVFVLQPGISYQWASSGTNVLSATLTSPYNGPGNLSSVTG